MNYITILNYTTGEIVVTKLPKEYEDRALDFIEDLFGESDCEYMITDTPNLKINL